MNEKELKRLSRRDLLEIMLAQTTRISELEKENKQLRKDLNDKKISISESGSLAEAAIKVVKIFEDADKAIELVKANIEAQANKEIEQRKKKEYKELEKYCDKKKKEADNILMEAKKVKKEKSKKVSKANIKNK